MFDSQDDIRFKAEIRQIWSSSSHRYSLCNVSCLFSFYCPLLLCCVTNSLLLRSHSGGYDKIFQATCEGEVESLRAFFQEGGDLTYGGPDGRTALHLAAATGQAEVRERET
jgi:hypothetical protein